MLGALIIVFREVLEAGLIVGIVMAATRGVAGRGQWVTIGIVAGVLGASVVAMFAGAISDAFQGSGQEFFNASVLGIAVLMLMWHNAWMARHGREIADEMRRVGTAVSEGSKPLTALAVVVGLAVLREGSEVVLFLYGILASGTSVSATLLGGVLGIVAGAAFTALTYFGLLAIPNRYIFSVTSWLIALLAAGMAAQSVHFLNNAGLVQALDQRFGIRPGCCRKATLWAGFARADRLRERPTQISSRCILTLIAMYLLMRFARYRRQSNSLLPLSNWRRPPDKERVSTPPPAQRGESDVGRLIDEFE